MCEREIARERRAERLTGRQRQIGRERNREREKEREGSFIIFIPLIAEQFTNNERPRCEIQTLRTHRQT